MTNLNKQQIANFVLWAAYGLALLASLNHVAWAFSTLEFSGQEWAGWLAALAVDAGLAALAYAIQQRRRAKRSVWTLWLGVGLFASISAYANLLHALTVEVSGATVTLSTFGTVDTLALSKAVILSATLPLLVVYLGEVVSGDDAEASKQAEAEQKRIERRERKEAEETVQQASDTPQISVLDGVNAAKQKSKGEALETLLEYLAEQPHASLSEAGNVIGRSKSTVGNYVAELEAAGRIKRNGNGVEVVG